MTVRLASRDWRDGGRELGRSSAGVRVAPGFSSHPHAICGKIKKPSCARLSHPPLRRTPCHPAVGFYWGRNVIQKKAIGRTTATVVRPGGEMQILGFRSTHSLLAESKVRTLYNSLLSLFTLISCLVYTLQNITWKLCCVVYWTVT